MQNTLKGWLVPNTVTPDPNDMILVLQSAGRKGFDDIIDEMLLEDTGLRRETLVHVVSLFQRMVARLLMNGYNVNSDLFYAVPRFTGVVEDGVWNPAKNGIYVSFTQDKLVREEVAKTRVEILGRKDNTMYILGIEDCKTGLKNGTVSPGYNVFVRGSKLKVTGTDASVGVTLTRASDNGVVKLEPYQVVVNNPSEVQLLLPPDLIAGDYTLTITTQYSQNVLLKTPRSVSWPVTVGTPATPDTPEGGDPDNDLII